MTQYERPLEVKFIDGEGRGSTEYLQDFEYFTVRLSERESRDKTFIPEMKNKSLSWKGIGREPKRGRNEKKETGGNFQGEGRGGGLCIRRFTYPRRSTREVYS